MNNVYYATNLVNRKKCACGEFDSLNHAIAFFNDYFNGDRYDICVMISSVFEHLYKSSAIDITKESELFYKKRFSKNKTYIPPAGSIIGTKLVTSKKSKV